MLGLRYAHAIAAKAGRSLTVILPSKNHPGEEFKRLHMITTRSSRPLDGVSVRARTRAMYRAQYEAREVSGAERDAWWARALEVWPDYAGYQTKTDRLIPVFVLTRIVV